MSEELKATTPLPWKTDGCDVWHRGESYESKTDPHLFTGITIQKELRQSPVAKANLAMAVEAVNALARLRSENAELREALRQSMPPIVTEATQLKALKASLAELAEKWSELGEGNECHHYNQCGDELRAKLKG